MFLSKVSESGIIDPLNTVLTINGGDSPKSDKLNTDFKNTDVAEDEKGSKCLDDSVTSSFLDLPALRPSQ